MPKSYVNATAAIAVLLAASVCHAQQCGDVDANGRVTASDALAVLNEAVGNDTDLACAAVFDCRYDGELQVGASRFLSSEKTLRLPVESLLPGHSAIACPDGRCLWVSTGSGVFKIAMPAFTIERAIPLRENFSWINDVSPDGTVLALSGYDSAGIVFTDSGDQRRLLPAGATAVGRTALTADALYMPVQNNGALHVVSLNGVPAPDIQPTSDVASFAPNSVYANPSRTRLVAQASPRLQVIDPSTNLVIDGVVVPGGAPVGSLFFLDDSRFIAMVSGGFVELDLADPAAVKVPTQSDVFALGSYAVELSPEKDALLVVKAHPVGCRIDATVDVGTNLVSLVQPEIYVVDLATGNSVSLGVVTSEPPSESDTYALQYVPGSGWVLVSATGNVHLLGDLERS
jgi:hypothetical protein